MGAVLVVEGGAGTATGMVGVECFGYDARNRLSGTTAGTVGVACPAVPVQSSLLVNEIGNLAGTPAGAAYTYGSGKPHAPSSAAGGTGFVWNPDGTLGSSTTAAGTTGYTWDPFDRLTRIDVTPTVGSPTVAKMAYWPGGQRALLVEGGVTHLYVGTFEERHQTSGGTVTDKRYYSHGAVTVAVREQTGSSNTLTVLLGDVRGSVAATVTATSTTTVATNANTYGPYGTPGTTGVTATSRGYIGQHTDSSGLDYLNNRYYQPTWGIFLTVDPLLDTTGQPYLYAGGNPTSTSDPNGLLPICARMGWEDTTPTLDGSIFGYHSQGSWYGSCATTSKQSTIDKNRRDRFHRENQAPGWSWVGHLILDGLGLIPAVGEVADGANAIWYEAEGNDLDAGISAASMIPWFGDSGKAGRYFDDLTDAGKYADDALHATNTVEDVIAETTNATSRNLTSAHTLTADEALEAGQQWVGDGYTELGKPGSGVFRSADGTRQFRIDDGSLTGAHTPGVPHVHLETYAPGARLPSVNNHIPFVN